MLHRLIFLVGMLGPVIFAILNGVGGLAQLARAFAWHAKGHRFDSGNLHRLKTFKVYNFGGLSGLRKNLSSSLQEEQAFQKADLMAFDLNYSKFACIYFPGLA